MFKNSKKLYFYNSDVSFSPFPVQDLAWETGKCSGGTPPL